MQHNNAFIDLVNEVRPFIKELTVQDVYNKFQRDENNKNNENFLFIDVREDHEWNESRLPKAIHIGRGVIERDIGNIIPNKNQEIILYCGGGFRSALAAYNLQKMGYTNIYSMDGGFHFWEQSNYPLDTRAVNQ